MNTPKLYLLRKKNARIQAVAQVAVLAVIQCVVLAAVHGAALVVTQFVVLVAIQSLKLDVTLLLLVILIAVQGFNP